MRLAESEIARCGMDGLGISGLTICLFDGVEGCVL